MTKPVRGKKRGGGASSTSMSRDGSKGSRRGKGASHSRNGSFHSASTATMQHQDIHNSPESGIKPVRPQSSSELKVFDYEMVIRQQPKQARLCGASDRQPKGPVDPPPVVRLQISRNTPSTASSSSSESESSSTVLTSASLIQSPYLFCFAALCKPDEDKELHISDDGRTKFISGNVVSSLYHLRDPQDGSAEGFFVFPDIGVRVEGKYRLKMSLYEMVDSTVHHCKTIFTEPFTVYSVKRFPGVEDSTELSKSFASQGLKMRIKGAPARSGKAFDAPSIPEVPLPLNGIPKSISNPTLMKRSASPHQEADVKPFQRRRFDEPLGRPVDRLSQPSMHYQVLAQQNAHPYPPQPSYRPSTSYTGPRPGSPLSQSDGWHGVHTPMHHPANAYSQQGLRPGTAPVDQYRYADAMRYPPHWPQTQPRQPERSQHPPSSRPLPSQGSIVQREGEHRPPQPPRLTHHHSVPSMSFSSPSRLRPLSSGGSLKLPSLAELVSGEDEQSRGFPSYDRDAPGLRISHAEGVSTLRSLLND